MKRASSTRPRLIAVDGVEASAIFAAAKAALAASTPGEPGARGGISRWDASGIFQDLAVADEEAGVPSARTLLLLYAADLAFRLRWQIRPALAEGRTVVVAPYVDTAMAFGRAAGLQAGWLKNLFNFAPRAAERHFVHIHPREAHVTGPKGGFVGFACERASGGADGRTGRRMLEETAARLRRADKGTASRSERS
jgi:hypothetical protein